MRQDCRRLVGRPKQIKETALCSDKAFIFRRLYKCLVLGRGEAAGRAIIIAASAAAICVAARAETP